MGCYYIDTSILTSISGGNYIDRIFPAPHSRLGRVFLLPYLDATSNGASGASTVMSPFSMAPNFTAPVNLLNVNLTIGNANVYSNPIKEKIILFYELYRKLCCAQFNGNSAHSWMLTSALTSAQWSRTPIYVFNGLDKCLSAEEWSLPDYPAGVKCNFIVVFEKQQSIMFNVINSEVAFQ